MNHPQRGNMPAPDVAGRALAASGARAALARTFEAFRCVRQRLDLKN